MEPGALRMPLPAGHGRWLGPEWRATTTALGPGAGAVAGPGRQNLPQWDPLRRGDMDMRAPRALLC